MAEKINLDAFLHELVSIINKKFESYEKSMGGLRSEIGRLRQSLGEDKTEELNNRIRGLENTINSMRDKNQIDRSILKILESEEHGRRA